MSSSKWSEMKHRWNVNYNFSRLVVSGYQRSATVEPWETGRGRSGHRVIQTHSHMHAHTYGNLHETEEQLQTHTHTHTHSAPTSQPLQCSMQYLSGKETDKSKWTYCRNRPWRSFDSGPPYSHWDTWWRENETQRGERGMGWGQRYRRKRRIKQEGRGEEK